MECVVSALFLTVMSCRTLTLFEIRNDNLQVTVISHFNEINNLHYIDVFLMSCKTQQLAVIKLNDKFGCIDRKGNIAI